MIVIERKKLMDIDTYLLNVTTKDIDKKDRVILAQASTKFIQSLATKKKSYEEIKSEMNRVGIWGKNYIHYIGKWDNYLAFIEKFLKDTKEKREV